MWHLGLAGMLLAFTAALATGEPRSAGADATGAPAADALHATHPTILRSLDRIFRGSPSWRAALAALVATGRRAVVVTPDQVVVRDAAGEGPDEPFDNGTLAAVSPVAAEDGRVSAVVVVINLPLLEALHERRGSLPAELDIDLDRLLAHEVYGHALPLLLAGHLSGRCPDPAPGQPAVESCAVQRENVVRAELNLGRRTDAGVNGLLLAFRGRH